jgi:superfamily II DNA or RNA helicase
MSLPSRPYIAARVDSRIHLQANLYPEKVVRSITDALTVPNLEKREAIRLGRRDANALPDFFPFYKYTGNELTFPRGFAHKLVRLMYQHGHDVVWDDRRIDVPMDPSYASQMQEIIPRSEQEPMIQVIVDNHQGILNEPPSTGKTVIKLEAIRRIGQRALILIHKKEIAAQWQDECKKHLGVPMGFIGDGRWEEEEITVALIQTLTSKKDSLLAENWYRKWGFVGIDESHQAAADTRIDLLQNFPSRYLFGLSATPGKQDRRIVEIMLGAIVQPMSKEEMYERGLLVRPRVYRVVTGFWAPPGTKYQTMMSQLIDDPIRNRLIADKIIDQAGSCQLVDSSRLRHLHTLKDLCERAGMKRLFMLTGEDSLERRQEVIHDAQENGNCVVFTTLGKEALNIPIADRLHLAYPISKPDLLIQVVGRIQRKHKRNRSIILYDYSDLPGPMTKQWANRALLVYKPSGWPVETIRP